MYGLHAHCSVGQTIQKLFWGTGTPFEVANAKLGSERRELTAIRELVGGNGNDVGQNLGIEWEMGTLV